MGKTIKQLHRELLDSRPDYAQAYDKLEVEFTLAHEVIRARTTAQLTQKELAKKMATSQAAIARMESGVSLPSVKTLKKLAEATGTHLRISLEA